MYISKNWLQDFVKIPDKISPDDLGLKMTMSMAEIEGYVDQKKSLQGVVVGEILEVKKHPDADKLQLAVVDVGSKNLDIVCGAPNIEAGQKVPVALVGTELANGMKIEKVKVRGEMSEGMLCAEDEIGLGSDHSGILILDEDLKVGEDLAKALGLDDIIYEIDNKSLTHRPDLWSHYGVAREVSSILGEKFKEYPITFREPQGDSSLNISVKDFKLCPRYMGVVLEGLEIQDSPEWLKKRIEAAGMRSINNIVDITNYVMLEIGQPLHAFDYDKLYQNQIIVRSAGKGEKIKTLDEQNRKLDENMLVIADAEKPVAIAGVMGGANTEISDQTSKIIIESANFDHVSIRKTSQKLGLRTEASIRFEKSLDPNIAELGIKKAAELILQCCPNAKLITKIEDVKKFKLDQGPIKLDFDFLNKRIGQEIEPKKVISILESLGFEVKVNKQNLEIKIPTWRATKDVSIPEDIVEEVARIYGYDNLDIKMPQISMQRPEINKQRDLERKIKNVLAYGYDMTETMNYSFISVDQIKKFDGDINDHVKILNPLTSETEYLRISLIPNLISNVEKNTRFFDDIRLFEVGSTFIKDAPGELISDKSKQRLPLQEKFISGIYLQKNNKTPFYDLKNIAENLLKRLHFDYQIEVQENQVGYTKKSRTVKIMINKEFIGYIAELDDKYYNKLHLEDKIAFFELNLTKLTDLHIDDIKYKPIPKFPSIELDISMIIDKQILWEKVRETVAEVDKELIKNITIFDVFEGKNIPDNKKSIAFRIEYRCDDKTLTMEEVQVIHNKVINQLETKLKGEIRK